MDLQTIKNQLPEYAKDLKLNIGSVLTPEGAPGTANCRHCADSRTDSP